MRIPHILLLLCSIGSALQASDKPEPPRYIKTIETTEPPIVTGGPDMPFKLNETFAFDQLKHDLYGTDYTLSEEQKQRVNEYINIFKQLRFLDSGGIKVLEKCGHDNFQQLSPDDFQELFPIDKNKIRDQFKAWNLSYDENTVEKLNDKFQTWRKQGIQSLMNAQQGYQAIPVKKPVPTSPTNPSPTQNPINERSEQGTLEGIFSALGKPVRDAYDFLSRAETRRAVGGALTGFCASYAPARLTTVSCEESTNILPLIATSVMSFGATVVGSTLCENDRSFWGGYVAGQLVGHTGFDNVYSHHERTQHTAMRLRQSTTVGSLAGGAARIACDMASSET